MTTPKLTDLMFAASRKLCDSAVDYGAITADPDYVTKVIDETADKLHQRALDCAEVANAINACRDFVGGAIKSETIDRIMSTGAGPVEEAQ